MKHKEALLEAVRVLKSGGVILYPTDTVWGLGCDATNQDAVNKLRDIKGREEGKGMLVLVADDGQLQRFVKEVPEVAWDLIDSVDKPTTIIYPEANQVAEGVPAPDGSLGVRMTKDEICAFLVRGMNRPLVSTSANFAGKTQPDQYSEIDPELLTAVDHVVELRTKEVCKKASTLIKLGPSGQIQILRK